MFKIRHPTSIRQQIKFFTKFISFFNWKFRKEEENAEFKFIVAAFYGVCLFIYLPSPTMFANDVTNWWNVEAAVAIIVEFFKAKLFFISEANKPIDVIHGKSFPAIKINKTTNEFSLVFHLLLLNHQFKFNQRICCC